MGGHAQMILGSRLLKEIVKIEAYKVKYNFIAPNEVNM